jgi:hypothetical protein
MFLAKLVLAAIESLSPKKPLFQRLFLWKFFTLHESFAQL